MALPQNRTGFDSFTRTEKTICRDLLPLAFDHNLHLPRILCLHGGGTNARIFRAQCRVIRHHLAHIFRLVFVDAPFLSQAGPDVESVYAEWGPFRSWLRPQGGPGPGSFAVDANDNDISIMDECIVKAMELDDAQGATGSWVGILGFSQGAKMAASLLLRQQARIRLSHRPSVKTGEGAKLGDVEFRFAVLLAGRGPLVMDRATKEFYNDRPFHEGLLHLPTIHVHGLRDPGLPMHRELQYRYCDQIAARHVEWDGDHRVPIKTQDVNLVVGQVLDVAHEYGVTKC
ncbi:putative LijB [Seiridium cardinale]|uniref:LijB n=1 Tax=Seiridium cardinale TaxID=138064 RepID=A0ABR2Y9G4_9PEZI